MTQPIIKQGTQQNSGMSARESNITAAKIMANYVRKTLGPKGMDVLIVDGIGDIIVTNDGVTILNEMQVEHPVGKMMQEVARTQEEVVGDGTTSAVILAAELLQNAEDLMAQGLHPTIILKGYREAHEQAQIYLDHISNDVTDKHKQDIMKTAMTGKCAESHKDYLIDLIMTAHKLSGENFDNVQLMTVVDRGVEYSDVYDGLLLENKENNHKLNSDYNGKTAIILDCSLGMDRKMLEKAQVNINNPEQLNQLLQQEMLHIRAIIQTFLDKGIQVIFTSQKINQEAKHQLNKAGVTYFETLNQSTVRSLSDAFKTPLLTNPNDFDSSYCFNLKNIEEKKYRYENFFHVSCDGKVTVLINASNRQVAEETKRAITDAIGDLKSVERSLKVVGGAGAVEVMLSRQLRKHADTVSSKEQLAIEAFAKAVESIPRQLITNAGLDTIDLMAKLKSAKEWSGIDVFKGEIINSFENGIVEPSQVKSQMLTSAMELAEQVLRVEDMIINPFLNGKQPNYEGAR